MATYFIGDIHGCYDSFKKILTLIKFNPKNDILWLTGDLVAKGPDSLKVLRLIYRFKHCVKIVLGNHDLNLIEQYSNSYWKQSKTKYFQNILKSNNSHKLIYWLRNQPILQIDEKKKIIMTHAGIHPTWNIHNIKVYATEIENILQSNKYGLFLHNLKLKQYCTDHIFNLTNQNLNQIYLNINIFTKMRYLFPNGQLDMYHKDKPSKTPYPLQAWFNIPRSIPLNYNIIFGHWSALEGKGTPHGIYGLDSGCYRGGQLTVLEWENKQFIRIPCIKNYSQ